MTTKPTTKELTREDLTAAIKLVHAEIEAYRKELSEIKAGEDQGPVMVEGETSTGYYCHLMVDPKDAARIMLDYDFPVYKILGEDAPEEMWEEMARKFGLESVSSVDL